MKFGFELSNVFGSVYTGGHVVFTNDGNSLLSPVGNRIAVFDLVQNRGSALPFQCRSNIAHLALSPDNVTLLAIDVEGHAVICNVVRKVAMQHFRFSSRVRAVSFSPCGKMFAVSHERVVQIWRAPVAREKSILPLKLHREIAGVTDDVVSLSWSPDSRFLLVGSKDLTAKVISADPEDGFLPCTLAGHRERPVLVSFTQDGDGAVTLSRDGAVAMWGCDRSGSTVRWYRVARHFIDHKHSRVSAAAFHARSGLLVCGLASGVFLLYDISDPNTLSHVQTLSISHESLSTVAISPSGEWMAFGCAALGQLLVWEWQSETYVLKQQGHALGVTAVAYSGDGQLIATGGEDAKVKLWNASSGYAFVTFAQHRAPVSAVVFVPSHGQAVLSASLDGTVRAFDLVRYRNFRTMVAPRAVQFASLAVDAGGEVVCAGTQDDGEICVWSLQTGQLLDILSGHNGPVSALAFSPTTDALASGSWDATVRLWRVFAGERSRGEGMEETLSHSGEVLAVAFRPDGREIACSVRTGEIQLWASEDGVLLGTIDGRRDIAGGRGVADVTTARHSDAAKHFTSLSYSPDGRVLIAGGNSRFVCLYETRGRVLVKKFELTRNRSLDGVLDYLDSRKVTSTGDSLDLVEGDASSDSDDDGRRGEALPGAQRGDAAKRRVRRRVRTRAVAFAPTGRAFTVATTEGVFLYALDRSASFDPTDLALDVTPANAANLARRGEYAAALAMALRLNDADLIGRCIDAVPHGEIQLIAQSVAEVHLQRLLEVLAARTEDGQALEYLMIWCKALFVAHGRYLKAEAQEHLSALRSIQRAIQRHERSLSRIADESLYSLQYISTAPSTGQADE